MEFIFELLFELFGEFFLQLAFELLAEAGLHIVRKPTAEHKTTSFWRLAIGYALFGLMVGAISLWAFPTSMMKSHAGRVLSLVLTPVLSGAAMVGIGVWRRRRGQQVLGIDRFLYGYIFAFAMALVRFHGAH